MKLVLVSPAGVLREAGPVRRAARRLGALGFEVALDPSALAKQQRFAGDDATRLAALHRVAAERPSVALATRGGYGLTRLLPAIDWKALGRGVEAGTRWVGHSDLTSLQLGLLASRRGGGGTVAWAGPLAADDFGRADVEGGGDDVTQACFVEAMQGELEGVGFRTGAGLDGLEARGTLWGGNLTVVLSLLGTPHWPDVKGGIFFFEDVNEHPYRIERGLLQLAQAGVLDRQRAILVGDVTGWRKGPNDRGYTLASALERVRAATRTPLVTGLPHGHGPLKVSLPVGARVRLLVDGRNAWVGW